MSLKIPERVVLLACGSFNPITNKHLRNFELARDYLHSTGDYDVVGGIVSPVSDAYPKAGLIAAKHRCAMIEAALKSSDWIRLDTWECQLDAWTETIDVTRHHQEAINAALNNPEQLILNSHNPKKLKMDLDNINNRLNQVATVTVKLLCGADLLESFKVPDLWKIEHIQDLVSLYGLVVITRRGSDPEKFIYESDVLYRNRRNVAIVTEWVENDISSTHVRRALERGESVKYLIPDSAITYAIEHNLYRDDQKC